MALEAWLAFFHITAILAWIVFASSQAALCHSDWMSTVIVQRLRRLDNILWWATAFVLLTGLARVFLGAKGAAYYSVNWLLYAKVILFFIVIGLQALASHAYRQWARAPGVAPAAAAVDGAHRRVMIATHLMAVIPLPAVFLARGFGA